MTCLELTDEQRRTLHAQGDWNVRRQRFRAFEDRAFETMKRAIHYSPVIIATFVDQFIAPASRKKIPEPPPGIDDGCSAN